MNVYVVMEGGDENAAPLGVFSTREMALAFADTTYAWVYEREVYDTIPAQITVYISERYGGHVAEYSAQYWPWTIDDRLVGRPIEAEMPAASRQWSGGLDVSGTNETEVRAMFREIAAE